MNKIEIKNRWNGNTIFEYEKENNTIKETLKKAVEEGADLSDADLRGAYLSDADLSDADLRGADLRGANLRGANLYVSDVEIDQTTIIEQFENNTNIKITESYINHDITPTRWSCFWKNGLIIRKWEVKPKPKAKEMTIEEISKALGYDVKVVERQ